MYKYVYTYIILKKNSQREANEYFVNNLKTLLFIIFGFYRN